MSTYAQLRRLAADCRADGEKAPISPDDLDHLLDVAENARPEQPARSVGGDTSLADTAAQA
ncbi:hypothetical protein DEO23_08695 [Brachybacterium endophyticum]|uniref:Uncharacterized protein n=1 Tax=Brachybacterium endophyticum TaxID=2182385 RepID=A0A2U2RM60_9MICO|nr:hypothetical protein [Brachybacterium endophyticum]PWH06959.1 hypothetical protein DEO23_08695 [Brachybacterium endophyticum]